MEKPGMLITIWMKIDKIKKNKVIVKIVINRKVSLISSYYIYHFNSVLTATNKK